MTDLRYAFRLLRRSPLFTFTILLTLVIGIGATTAIFSVVNAILLRPLPFAEPDRLMQVAEKNDKLNLRSFSASALNYLSWKEQTRTFDALGAIRFNTFTLSGHGDPETYTGDAISPSLIPLLGLQPLLGRTFAEGDDQARAPAVVLISESLWRRRFGADPAVDRTCRDVERNRLHRGRHRAGRADRADHGRHLGAARHRSAEGDAAQSRALRGRPAASPA